MAGFVSSSFVSNNFVDTGDNSAVNCSFDLSPILNKIDNLENVFFTELNDLRLKIDGNRTYVISEVARYTNSIENSISSKSQSIKDDISVLKDDINFISSKIDFTSVNDNFNSLKDDITSLLTSRDENVFNKFPSLNGAYGSFVDGSFVTSTIYKTKLTVLGSFLALNEADNYIIFYIVENLSNNVIILPSVFVNLYVENTD